MALFPMLLCFIAVLFQFFTASEQKSAIVSLSTDLVKNQRDIVNKHNEFRRTVFPPATNMLRMQWCNESARNAQNWAEKCTLEHSSKDERKINNSGCGENIYKASYAASWSKVIGFWNSEYENFIYGTGPKTNKSVIEDYVQVVWFSSWRIGCGISYCANASEGYFYVCHYCPGSSNQDKLHMPYVRGERCGACPNDCDNGLCTNGCAYEDTLPNCKDLVNKLGCKQKITESSCKASCNCEDKIY